MQTPHHFKKIKAKGFENIENNKSDSIASKSLMTN